MKTNSRTTYILLERGIEDVALVVEFKQLLAEIGAKDIRSVYLKYPRLMEVFGALQDEVRAQRGSDV